MHDSALRIGELVMQTYCDLPKARILEIGSMDVNGSLRDFAKPTTKYVGVDLEDGPAVDVVIKPGEKLPFDDDSFDLIMASSAFEHDPKFWDTFIEMCRVAKPGGHVYVNAPSNGGVHRYPLDCWRFYPDAGLALVEHAQGRAMKIDLVESFIGKRYTDSWDGWNDFVAVFRRGPSKQRLNEDFIYKKYPSDNARTWNSSTVDRETGLTESMQRERDLRQKIRELEEGLTASSTVREQLTGEVAQLRSSSASLEQQVQALSNALQAQSETFGRLERERAEAARRIDQLTADLTVSRSEASLFQSASESLEQQVHLLSTSIQAQTDAFTRVQERDLDQIKTLESDLARLRATHSSHVEQTASETARLRTRVAELEAAMRHDALQHERARGGLQWLRALHIALSGRPAWWSVLPKRSQRDKELAMLRSVGLFDDQSYLSRYPDVAAAKMDALEHYVAHGLREGRSRI